MTEVQAVPDPPVYSPFAVSVSDVLRLLDTLSVVIVGENKDQHGRPAREGTAYLTDKQVSAWIVDVGSRVTTRLALFHRVRPESRLYKRVSAAGRDIVANGAASYTYAASAPEKAAIVDSTSYAEVLWRRFLTGLDDLEAAFDEWVRQFPDDLEPDASTSAKLPGSGVFRRPAFRDYMTW